MRKIWILPVLALIGLGLWLQPYPLWPQGPCPYGLESVEHEETTDGIWLRGKVVFPADWNAAQYSNQELPQVTAFGAPWPDDSSPRTVTVQPDGAFRIPIAPGSRMGRLMAHSDTLGFDGLVTWFPWHTEAIRLHSHWKDSVETEAPAPTERIRIRGQLTSQHAEPLRHAWVQSIPMYLPGEEKTLLVIEAPNGAFDFEVPGPLPVTIDAGAEDHDWLTFEFNGKQTQDLQLTLQAPKPYRGRILDRNGQPLAGAQIEVLLPNLEPDPGLGPTDQTTTDEEGRFSLFGFEKYRTIPLGVSVPRESDSALTPGSAALIQHFPKVAMQGDPEPLRFDPQAHSVSIQVQGPEKQPVPEFQLVLEPLRLKGELLTPPAPKLKRPKRAGALENLLKRVLPDDEPLVVEAQALDQDNELTQANEVVRDKARLIEAIRLQGHIQYKLGSYFGSPLKGALKGAQDALVASSQKASVPGALSFQCNSADGNLTVHHLPKGYWKARIIAPGFSPKTKDTLRSPRKKPAILTLSRTGRVLITVLDDSGTPWPGVEVRLRSRGRNSSNPSPAPITTDHLGRARFFDLAPGRYRASVGGSLDDLFSETRLSVAPGDRIEESLRSTPVGALHGKIDWKGPEFFTLVSLIQAKSGKMIDVAQVFGSEFYFEGVPTGRYRVEISQGIDTYLGRPFVASKELRIFKHRTQHVQLETFAGYGLVTGTVRLNGQPVAEGRIEYISDNKEGQDQHSKAPTAGISEGKLTGIPLLPGPYTLRFEDSSGGYGLGTLLVESGFQEGITLELNAASLSLQFQDPLGQPISVPPEFASTFQIADPDPEPNWVATGQPNEEGVLFPTLRPGKHPIHFQPRWDMQEFPWALAENVTCEITQEAGAIQQTITLEPRYPLQVEVLLNEFDQGSAVYLFAGTEPRGDKSLQFLLTPDEPRQTVRFSRLPAQDIWITALSGEEISEPQGPFRVTPDGQAKATVAFDRAKFQ